MKSIGDAVTLGFELVLPALLLAYAGNFLDRYFKLPGILMIAGLFLGAGAGVWTVTKRYYKGNNGA